MSNIIDAYDNKEHITQINERYIFFKFSDGNQESVKTKKQDLLRIQEWVHDELGFYDRMYWATKEIYDTEKVRFHKTRHYYSGEEVQAACLNNSFAYINMDISNKKYKEDWNRIVGMGDLVLRINNKYGRLRKLSMQIKNVLNVM